MNNTNVLMANSFVSQKFCILSVLATCSSTCTAYVKSLSKNSLILWLQGKTTFTGKFHSWFWYISGNEDIYVTHAENCIR